MCKDTEKLPLGGILPRSASQTNIKDETYVVIAIAVPIITTTITTLRPPNLHHGPQQFLSQDLVSDADEDTAAVGLAGCRNSSVSI